MRLFSVFFKPELNEYIAFKSKARPEGFLILIVLKPRHFYVFSLFRTITLPAEKAQEAGQTIGVHFLGKETAVRYDFGGICWKILEGGEVLLSGAQGLFERQRVALRTALLLNNSSDS